VTLRAYWTTMSEQNLEVVRRSLDAWNRRDLDGALGEMHPDCVVDWSASHGPESGIYRGRERVRRFYEEWLELFDEVDIQPEELSTSVHTLSFPTAGSHEAEEGSRWQRAAPKCLRFARARSFA
jgi:ketosteroid isomerase-like protein